MNTQELYEEIKNLSKEQKTVLMQQVFLDTSFDIIDIIAIKEMQLKRLLQRKHNLLVMADTRMGILVHAIDEKSNKKKDIDFLEKQSHEAKKHLIYSNHAGFSKNPDWADEITPQELAEYERDIRFDKNLRQTSSYADCTAHLTNM